MPNKWQNSTSIICRYTQGNIYQSLWNPIFDNIITSLPAQLWGGRWEPGTADTLQEIDSRILKAENV